MPKTGFKSITISEEAYKRFHTTYDSNRADLTKRGINSFSGYITYMIEDRMQSDVIFAKYAPMLEEISVLDDRILIKDNMKKRVAEVALQNGKLFCLLCENKNCSHVGFAFGLPTVYKALSAKGVKINNKFS